MQELAVMMDMPKKQVLETVNENRADELSAMFNMMLDEKKKVLGEWIYSVYYAWTSWIYNHQIWRKAT